VSDRAGPAISGRSWSRLGNRPGSRPRCRLCRRLAALALASALGLSEAAAGIFDSEEEEEAISEEEVFDPAGPRIAYEVRFTGGTPEPLLAILRQSARLVTLQERPPPSLTALERRAESDIERLETALRSEGYYAGEVGYQIDRAAEPVLVTLAVDAGAPYRLAAYEISYFGDQTDGAELPRDPAALGLVLNGPARAPQIVAAEKLLLRRLASSGYPLARKADRRAFVVHDDELMRVELVIDPGPAASFGPLTIEGLQDVEESYVRELVPWQQGERFDRSKLDDLRIALSRTALFDSVTAKEAEALDAAGGLPITLRLIERKQRSIGAGASYSTSEGPGLELFWEHRNLLGRNEQLRVSTEGSLIEQRLEGRLRKPHFWSLDQVLLANAAFVRADNEAYQEESVETYIGLEKSFSETWRGTAGLSGEYQIIEDAEEGERQFTFFGTPVTAVRDTSDDLLNPTEGTRLALKTTPAVGFGNETLLFLTNEISGSAYYAVDASRNFILAGRARIGSIVGAETSLLPADKRFYSGGGGSVRGYAFQKLGPLDEDDDPLGGRSVLELGAEVRIRVYEDFGVVPFVEGGIVGDRSFVDFDEEFLWSVGLGLRYFTPIGPLRLDVAFPVNPRDSDDFFQFYVSLGQAF